MKRANKLTILAVNMVIKICEKARAPHKALALIKEMEDAG